MSRIRSYLVLLVLWAGYFHPLFLHPNQTLYTPYSDFLAEHLPAKLFLNAEWRSTGELPLWNPYHFCGSPFVHDIQVGMFYPPHAVVYLLTESAVGAALSWVIALHVLAAGVFAYIYARANQLNEVGSIVTAVGFMLSSKWLTHMLLVGQTITIGLAWLPLVLLGIERGIAKRGTWPVIGAGVALALFGLGTHPQWAFYAGVFAVVWTLPAERWKLPRWIACWAGAATIAILLTAVQLFPTLEASRWSARSSGLDATGTLTIGFTTFFHLVGPSRDYTLPHSWEMQGVFGLFWLGAATAAPILVGGRAKWQFGVLCSLVLFSVGGAVLVEWLPGFNMFRVPTRMLVVAAFPLAFLAGATTDMVIHSAWGHEARWGLSRGFRRATLFAGLPTILGLAFSEGHIWRPFVAYWLVVLVSVFLFIRLLQNRHFSLQTRTALWLVILIAELLAPVATLPDTRPQAELYPSSRTMAFLTAQPPEGMRVLDWDMGDEHSRVNFLGTGAPDAMVYRVPTPRGYNPLDVRHYREFLAFVVNDDRPVRGNSPYTQQVIPNFEVENPSLFQLLCVTHRVAPENAPPLPGEWKAVFVDPAPPAPPPYLPDAPATLAPQTLSTDANPQSRAWIVPRAERMPVGNELAALKRCAFSQTVLLNSESLLQQAPTDQRGSARITEYRPNRVTIELNGTPGWLVLSEVWYPGWKCRVDGVEVPVYRANHAFRAVPVLAGAKSAEFTFAPRSYEMGWWVSVVAVGVLGLGCVGGAAMRLLRRGRSQTEPQSGERG